MNEGGSRERGRDVGNKGRKGRIERGMKGRIERGMKGRIEKGKEKGME